MRQFKLCIKQPDSFEKEYQIEMNKNNVKVVYWMKNAYMFTMKLIQLFLRQTGIFSHKNNQTFKQFLCNQLKLVSNSYKMLQDLDNLIGYLQSMDRLRKINLMNNLYLLIMRQSRLQTMQQDLNKFIQLYSQFQSCNNGQTKLIFKFNTSSDYIFKIFNFNILLETICLKDKSTNIIQQQSKYDQQKYENQFVYLNDGEYYYRNCYRFNMFCEEEEVERDRNCFIGREFLVNNTCNNNSNNTCNNNSNNNSSNNNSNNINNNNNNNNSNNYNRIEQHHQKIQHTSASNVSHVIQVSPYLPQSIKLSFRLRLTSEYYSVVSIGIRYSSSFQYFSSQIHNFYIDIKLKIIPDVGQSSVMYKYVKDYIKGIKVGNKLYQFYDMFDGNEEEGYLVLEDDIVSVYWQQINYNNSNNKCYNNTTNKSYNNTPNTSYNNTTNKSYNTTTHKQQQPSYLIKKVSFVNQTRQILLKTLQFKHQKQQFGHNYISLPIFGAVALYNSIAEVQIFNQQK